MSELIVTRHGRVLQLTLNRPAARNALNNALLTQLAEQLEAAAVDADIAVCVIYGSERCFAAGADLNEMAEKDLPATLNDIRPQLWARINAFPKPLIAAVNGFALGAGCELALLCDVVIAGDNARFGLPEITLGIMPGAGGTQRLIRSVGKSLASKMVLTGESISAGQALNAGLVSDVFPAALTLEYALKQAALMARHSRWRCRRPNRRCASPRRCRSRPGWRRSASCLRCFLPPKTAGKASTPSYKNAPPTLKDANCGMYSQSCRTGRDDPYAEPSGASEQL